MSWLLPPTTHNLIYFVISHMAEEGLKIGDKVLSKNKKTTGTVFELDSNKAYITFWNVHKPPEVVPINQVIKAVDNKVFSKSKQKGLFNLDDNKVFSKNKQMGLFNPVDFNFNKVSSKSKQKGLFNLDDFNFNKVFSKNKQTGLFNPVDNKNFFNFNPVDNRVISFQKQKMGLFNLVNNSNKHNQQGPNPNGRKKPSPVQTKAKTKAARRIQAASSEAKTKAAKRIQAASSARTKVKTNAAKKIQTASSARLSKFRSWISSQRAHMQHIYPQIKNTLIRWTTVSNKRGSNSLQKYLEDAPKTPANIPGFLYRKVVLSPRERLNLNLSMATSWTLNPLFGASYQMEKSGVHILLRLPLKTPASKLYIGDTSSLLNSSQRTPHKTIYAREAEVILAPVDLEIVRERTIPLGMITGINSKTGESRKRLSTYSATDMYVSYEGLTKEHSKYHAAPNRYVTQGLQAQETLITVLDVKEIDTSK